jgi:hypothetical protein
MTETKIKWPRKMNCTIVNLNVVVTGAYDINDGVSNFEPVFQYAK